MTSTPPRLSPRRLLPTSPYHDHDTHTVFSITTDYLITMSIGSGQYARVYAAVHVSSGLPVAIRRVALPSHSSELYASRTLRELRILRFLKACTAREGVSVDNIVYISDLLQIPDVTCMDAVYVVTRLMTADLRRTLASNLFLGDPVVACLSYYLLRTLKYLHSAGIAHRDIKPENILVNDDCDVVLGDFGLARDIDHNTDMTDYVETRWYRAPELIMGLRRYNEKVDIWSLGCVMAEMLMPVGRKRIPLWRGKNAWHQVMLIVETIGLPSVATLVAMGFIHSPAIASLQGVAPGVPLRERFEDWRRLTLTIAGVPAGTAVVVAWGGETLRTEIKDDGSARVITLDVGHGTWLTIQIGDTASVTTAIQDGIPMDGVELRVDTVSVNPMALDLLEGMLAFDPEKRLSAAQCLAHPYYAKDYHIISDEPSCQTTFSDDDFASAMNLVEGTDRSHALKEMIYAEMMAFHGGGASSTDGWGSSFV